MTSSRLFFALWPDASVRQQVAARTGELLPAGARAVAADNLHITLAFLGNSDARQQECYHQAAARVRAAPFQLRLDSVGHFPRPQVLWLGCREIPAAASDLYATLNAVLAGCGYLPDNRTFIPHMTLARKCRRGPGAVTVAEIDWWVDTFVLVRSLTLPDGVRYEVVQRWPLQA